MSVDTSVARVPPHSIEAETCVLGSMMLDPGAVADVLPLLRGEYFYRKENRDIFGAILDLYERNQPTDLIVMIDELKKRGLLEEVGGAEYVMELAESVPDAINAEHYARIVRDKAFLRDIINTSTQIVRDAYEERGDVEDIVNRVEGMIFDAFALKISGEGFSVKEIIRDTLSRIDDYHRRDQRLTGLETGLRDLDDLLSGFQNSQLIIVAGRPSMGKSSLALNIATNIGVRARKAVLLFSLEADKQQVVQNMLCAFAKVDAHSLRRGMLPEEEVKRLLIAAGDLGEAPIFIDDTASLSPLDVRARARRFAAKHKVELVIVDYLQLMYVHRAENRQLEIALISRSLKALARELRVPVIAVSQLSRAVESREDRRPRMSDLRESGALEQDADVVIMLYREDYYKRDEPGHVPTSKAELIVAKQRNGPTGTVNLRFDSKWMRFDNLAREQERYE